MGIFTAGLKAITLAATAKSKVDDLKEKSIKVKDKGIKAVATTAAYIPFVVFIFFFVIFFLVLLGSVLTEYLVEHDYTRTTSNFMTAGIFVLVMFFLYLFRKGIHSILSKTLTAAMAPAKAGKK